MSCLRRKKRCRGGGGLSLTAPKRGKQRSLAATTGEQRTGGGGVGNGMEGPFYRRALEGKMDDGGCLHVGAHACARSRGPGRARLAAGGVSVKETRSCTAYLLRLSKRARWRDAE
jgi:hypothetical protein